MQPAPITITEARIDGLALRFATDMERDPIQRHHRRGAFYEARELKTLGAFMPEGGCFLDIGANVGNHSLYAALFWKAGRVIPIEPNPRARRLLQRNCALNGLEGVIDLSCLGVGLSDRSQEGFGMEERQRNLGGARMLPGAGDLQVRRADEGLPDLRPDVIKIDVEGMEIAVLEGLGALLDGSPALLVEVDTANAAGFADWMQRTGYGEVARFQRYRRCINHILRRGRA
ncbi:MAG: FkbM family methyltransferase [Rhodobacteraceae bacterium]|nr:FkbM family methyltransferase [Paracoccaceae bacterium]MBR9821130.1 FkbM family methyltransferase [Paracoccaceae bacterium]